MDSMDTYWADRSALEWQVELGADEAIGDTPVNRYEIPEKLAKPAASAVSPAMTPPEPAEPVKVDAIAVARELAQSAADLDALRTALDAFDMCEPKRAARNTVFAQGDPAARVLIVGEAPDRDVDRAGTPFAGAAQQLLGRMFDAIGMGQDVEDPTARIYTIAPIPWRSPAQPQPHELDMMKPFLERHITLANPDIVLVMGNTACQMLLGRAGVSRLRGNWTEALGRPVLPMLHPVALIQNPSAKRDAWADLLALKAKLKGSS